MDFVDDDDDKVDVSSIIVPLLSNPMTKSLELDFWIKQFQGCQDFLPIKVALESNKGLEKLKFIRILFAFNDLKILNWFFKGSQQHLSYAHLVSDSNTWKVH
jgi:hypothetical protein